MDKSKLKINGSRVWRRADKGGEVWNGITAERVGEQKKMEVYVGSNLAGMLEAGTNDDGNDDDDVLCCLFYNLCCP